MRALACVCFLAGCLGLVGCSTFGKKAQAKPNLPARQPGGADWLSQPDGSGTASAERTPPGLGGLLAGRVLDSYDRRPPRTYIRVISAQEKNEDKTNPMEVEVDPQGYFTIQGLQPGHHYELIARTRDGESKMAGRTWATPPNPRLLIYMSEDFATPNTPAAPRPPSIPGQRSGAPSEQSAGAAGSSGADANRDLTKPNNINGPAPRAADIGAPLRLNDTPQPAAPPAPATPPQPRTDIRPENITADPDGYARRDPPVNIPPQTDVRDQPPPGQSPSLPPAIPAVATQVPSCVLTGRQLDNFALNDLNGQPWEYRQHRGKVVLLDFWGTWCVPCRDAIPHLRILQDTYGPYGLEVVGIAYEDGTLLQQIRKVQGVRDRLGINYRLLLGSGINSCPVRTQFQVSKFPTLVLLDESNQIIWRAEGLDPDKLQDLEMLIRQQLRGR